MIPTILTIEAFNRLPRSPGKQELIEGELIQLPPASYRHNQIVHRLFRVLDHATDGGALMEAGYHLGSSCVQPDVSVPHEGQAAGTYLEGGPLLAIEVVSPANTATALQRKLRLYFASGTREVWLVYPETCTIEVHYPQGSVVFTEPFESALVSVAVNTERIFA